MKTFYTYYICLPKIFHYEILLLHYYQYIVNIIQSINFLIVIRYLSVIPIYYEIIMYLIRIN